MRTPQGDGATVQRDLQAEVLRAEVRLHDVPHEDRRLRLLLPEAMPNLPACSVSTRPVSTQTKPVLAATTPVKRSEARKPDNFDRMSFREPN